MKQREIKSLICRITTGVVATSLFLLVGCSSIQTDKAGSVEKTRIKPGKNFTISLSNDVNLEMIWIKPGTFMMGSPENELGREDEVQHEMPLTQGYWLGKYEVTQPQYEAVMGTNPSKFKGSNLPVERVSWDNAMEFCATLTEQEKAAGRLPEGYEYTLPTEVQWEYACRAGTTTALNSGKNLTSEKKCSNMDEVGWYGYNSGKYDTNGRETRNGKTYPVGLKLPNAWGLYDMHGNVAEWCLDLVLDYRDHSNDSFIIPNKGNLHVLCGGCWDRNAKSCRSSARSSGWGYGDNFGFRIVLSSIKTDKNCTVSLSNDVELEMILIKPGIFTMGCSATEVGKHDNETQHQVALTKEYWLGKYEVTQCQYEAVMGKNPSWFKGPNLPVECVSWDDAMEFCAKLTKQEKVAGRLPKGYEYTLPTEAQWEYACRAGTITALNSGKNLSNGHECSEMYEVGWYGYNSGKYDADGKETGNGKTYPVGQKKPNAWGLYDMHGNVVEWCLDWYGEYPISSVTDPKGSSTGSERVARGGTWDCNASHCRSASRGHATPSHGYLNCGFRVALSFVQ